MIGIAAKRFQSNTPYQMVVSWVGMPTNKNWLRCDITRHLECVPRISMKDIIAVEKAIPNQ